MSTNLPPYSTFRTDPKQQIMFPHAKSYGNVLTFTPPGFKQSLNVKFPDSRLAVCVSCKKNFKTKDMCRVRNQHTRPPWTTAFICMTLDASCTDEDGNYVDKPFIVRMVQWRPFSVMEDFAPKSKTPVCETCKTTNRTRSFCRDRHKHRKLPWSTVYVMLSTQESADPSTVVAAPSRKIEAAKDADGENSKGKMNASASPSIGNETSVESQTDTHQLPETTIEANGESAATRKTKTSASDQCKQSSTEGGDDINDVPESRTMLIQINDEDITISWLQQHDDDSSVKGVWAPQPQPPLQQQQQKYMPVGTTLIQSAQVPKYSFPPVAPATVRVPKRNAESSIPIDTQQDAYHQHAISGYNATGQPLYHAVMKGNEPPQHPYPYPLAALQPPPQYNGHAWPYPTATHPHPQQTVPQPHMYITTQLMQQRPTSPAPAIGSPGGSMIGGSSPSPSVTAGEAAAMRRKKPRREFETDDHPESQPLNPSPPPSAPTVPQLQHPPVNYGEIALAPGPPPPGAPPIQQPQHLPGQLHQEQYPWMVYQQMYQAQLQPTNTQYSNDSSRMTVGTPESASRSFHHHDESPNNVTMTPGSGDGGGDHDSDTDFNRPSLL